MEVCPVLNNFITINKMTSFQSIHLTDTLRQNANSFSGTLSQYKKENNLKRKKRVIKTLS